MTTKEFKKNTISLWSLGHLMKMAGKDVKHKINEIHELVEEFKKNNDISSDKIKRLTELINSVLEDLENIKKYDRREEYKTIKNLHEFIMLFVGNYLFGLLTSDSKDFTKEQIENLINEVKKTITTERKNSKRILHNRKPKTISFLDKIEQFVASDKHLAKDSVTESRLIDHLKDKDTDLLSQLTHSIHYLDAKNGRISHEEFHKIKEMILALIEGFRQEIHIEFDIDNDAELFEFRIESMLKELSKIKNEELHTALEKLNKTYFELIKRDAKEFRKMKNSSFNLIKNMMENFKHFLSKLNKFMLRFAFLVFLHQALATGTLSAQIKNQNSGLDKISFEITQEDVSSNKLFNELEKEITTQEIAKKDSLKKDINDFKIAELILKKSKSKGIKLVYEITKSGNYVHTTFGLSDIATDLAESMIKHNLEDDSEIEAFLICYFFEHILNKKAFNSAVNLVGMKQSEPFRIIGGPISEKVYEIILVYEGKKYLVRIKHADSSALYVYSKLSNKFKRLTNKPFANYF